MRFEYGGLGFGLQRSRRVEGQKSRVKGQKLKLSLLSTFNVQRSTSEPQTPNYEPRYCCAFSGLHSQSASKCRLLVLSAWNHATCADVWCRPPAPGIRQVVGGLMTHGIAMSGMWKLRLSAVGCQLL